MKISGAEPCSARIAGISSSEGGTIQKTRIMKINPILLLVGLFALPMINHADAGKPLKVDELRAEYTAARQAYEAIKKPKLGEKDFQQELGVWAKTNSRHRKAARALTRSLVPMVSELPPAEFQPVEAELRQIHSDIVVASTQSGHDSLQFFAELILPEVRDKQPAADRVALFVELTQPDNWIREIDRLIKKDVISEPTGWGIQDVHALALARAGKFDSARKESDLLLKKVNATLPGKFETNHFGRVRTKESLYREFLMHRALIEALSGENKAAEKRLAQAKAIKEADTDIQKIQTPLEKAILKRTGSAL